jgi:tetrahydromethanopterin S-methyltransferase subunit G
MYMNETITILEALIIGLATVLVYVLVKTIFEHYFKSSK